MQCILLWDYNMARAAELDYDTPGIEPELDTQRDQEYLDYLVLNEQIETRQVGRLRQCLRDARGMPFAELHYRNEIHQVLTHLRWVRSQITRLH